MRENMGQTPAIASLSLSGGLEVVRCQLASPLSKEKAVSAAVAQNCAFNWQNLFDGLEAAGFIVFLGDE